MPEVTPCGKRKPRLGRNRQASETLSLRRGLKIQHVNHFLWARVYRLLAGSRTWQKFLQATKHHVSAANFHALELLSPGRNKHPLLIVQMQNRTRGNHGSCNAA